MNEQLQQTSQKPHWRFSQAKVTLLEFLPSDEKNDYRSFINIVLIRNIGLHTLAISTFNKDNG